MTQFLVLPRVSLGPLIFPYCGNEVEQELRPSGNGDREAILVRAGLCDVEGDRASNVYDSILGSEKYLKLFKRIQTFCWSKNLAKTEQFDLKIFDPISISLFAHTRN